MSGIGYWHWSKLRGELDALERRLGENLEAQAGVRASIEQARSAARDLLEKEAERLVALQTINPNVRDEEITFFQQQLAETLEQIDQANIRLDAIRVLVAI